MDVLELLMWMQAFPYPQTAKHQFLDILLKLGQLDVLDAFRTYVYYGSVSGSNAAGLSVSALKAVKSGQNNQDNLQWKCRRIGGALLTVQ